MAREKGTTLLHLQAYAEAQFGAAAWQRALVALTEEERHTLSSVVAVGWYDTELFLKLLALVEATAAAPQPDPIERLAVYEAERDLRGIHRLFLRMANPAFVLEKASEYWSRFHDEGHFVVERPTETSAIGTLRGLSVVDARYCRYLRGYIRRLLELVGARGVYIEHTECRARGAELCRFRGQWQ